MFLESNTVWTLYDMYLFSICSPDVASRQQIVAIRTWTRQCGFREEKWWDRTRTVCCGTMTRDYSVTNAALVKPVFLVAWKRVGEKSRWSTSWLWSYLLSSMSSRVRLTRMLRGCIMTNRSVRLGWPNLILVIFKFKEILVQFFFGIVFLLLFNGLMVCCCNDKFAFSVFFFGYVTYAWWWLFLQISWKKCYSSLYRVEINLKLIWKIQTRHELPRMVPQRVFKLLTLGTCCFEFVDWSSRLSSGLHLLIVCSSTVKFSKHTSRFTSSPLKLPLT